MLGADASDIVQAVALQVKWSVSTSIQVYPLTDNVIAPTRSIATACYGRTGVQPASTHDLCRAAMLASLTDLTLQYLQPHISSQSIFIIHA